MYLVCILKVIFMYVDLDISIACKRYIYKYFFISINSYVLDIVEL
jgi:hypothetical protein